MQLKFSALLAGILVALSTEALPHPKRVTHGGIVTLPLRRIEQRSDVNPQIAHQQNINRSHRRYARMSGRAEPSDEELSQSLHRRVLAVEGEEGLFKRYNRLGVPQTKPKAKAKVAGSGPVLASAAAHRNKSQPAGNRNGNHRAKGHSSGKAAAAGAAGVGVGAGVGLGAGAGALNGTDTGAGNSTDTGAGAGAVNGTDTGAGNSTDTGAGTAAGNGTASSTSDPVTKAGPPTGQDSLGLDIESTDIGYLATIKMGTPPRDFSILMDSGSADLWVGAENCVSDAGGTCGEHIFLGANSSSSFQDTKTPFSVTYGTGAVSGSIVTDDIIVAGLTLKGHKFGVATTESVEFSDNATPFDGLMGLAQSTLSQQQTLTPIEALAQAGTVKAAITSYKIPRLADKKNDGEITFGGTDPTKFDAKTQVLLDNVSQQGFWEANMDAVTIDGTDLGLTGRTAILDTGTTLIIAPAADAIAIHEQITGAKSDGQGGFTVPCTTNASVALTFGGTSFAIDPRDIAFVPLDPADPTGDCISGIASGDIGGAQEWLVGDVFLKNAYFSTDVGNNQVSLAKLV